MAQKETNEAADKYDADFCDHVLKLLEDKTMLQHTKTALLDILAFKISCASVVLQTNIDPNRLVDYRLLMLPNHQIESVTKYLEENFNNTLANSGGHHG